MSDHKHDILVQACHQRKHCMCGCCMPKQHFIALACNSELHTIIIWCVISVRLNIGKKITRLEISLTNKQTYFSNLYWLNCLWWHIFKSYFLLCSNMFCEMFYLLCCFVFARLKCFCVLFKLICLLLNTI